MSQENVEVVRRAVDYISETGEPDWGLYDPDLIWITRPDGPAHYTYRGLDGLRRGNESLREAWAELRGEILEVIESGDAVVSVIRWHLQGHSGVDLEVVEGWAVWLRDGKITRIEQHATKEDALEAAGLREQAMSKENVETMRRILAAFNSGAGTRNWPRSWSSLRRSSSRCWRGLRGRIVGRLGL